MNEQPVLRLICCCCGGLTTGRQWWNRDDGFGICERCVLWIREKHTFSPEEFTRHYGEEGVHHSLTAGVC